MMENIFKKWYIAMLFPIPAMLIGALVMHSNEISPIVYGQNIICYLVLGLILFLLSTKLTGFICDNHVRVFIIIFAGLTACTFLDSGLENVYRWLIVGGFRLYITSIVLPSMVIGLGLLLQRGGTIFPVIIVVSMLIILALQPDASQLSAFAVSTTFLLYVQPNRRPLKWVMLLLSSGFVVYSWIYIDALEAVPHVEDIIILAWDMGATWFILGILSLVLLLVPFLAFSKASVRAKAVGVYYLIVLVSTVFGNFPVPLMGFGISPIIGYLLAAFLLYRENFSNYA